MLVGIFISIFVVVVLLGSHDVGSLTDAQKVWCDENGSSVRDAGLSLKTPTIVEDPKADYPPGFFGSPLPRQIYLNESGVRETTVYLSRDAFKSACRAAYELYAPDSGAE